MTKSVFATAAAVVVSLLAPGGLAAQQPDVATVADMASFPQTDPDHVIAYGSDPQQYGHLRLPAGPGPHPVMVFMHGGCWLSLFDIGYVSATESALVDEGYAVWSITYRRVGDPGSAWPATFEDVGNGIDHVRAIAREHPLDLDRVLASGHSAGGQLALWAAARPRIDRSSPLWRQDPLEIDGVLALAPAPDFDALHAEGTCGNVIDALMGGSPAEHPDRYEAASPMRLMAHTVPQTVVVGAYDEMFGAGGRSFFEAADRAGVDVSLREATEAGHFEVVMPWSTTWPVILEELAELERRVGW